MFPFIRELYILYVFILLYRILLFQLKEFPLPFLVRQVLVVNNLLQLLFIFYFTFIWEGLFSRYNILGQQSLFVCFVFYLFFLLVLWLYHPTPLPARFLLINLLIILLEAPCIWWIAFLLLLLRFSLYFWLLDLYPLLTFSIPYSPLLLSLIIWSQVIFTCPLNDLPLSWPSSFVISV